jgi:membrane-bound serine protease (ClpP class)
MGWIIFFFLVGAGLIFIECFMPGIVCGVLGASFLVISAGLAIRDHPEWAVLIILTEAVGTVTVIMLAFYLLPKTRMGRRMVLETAQHVESGWVSDMTNETLLGTTGTVFTALRPAGTIMVRGQRVNAVSTGEFIEDGMAVRVVEVHGNRVVVEPVAITKERRAR